MPDRHGVLQSVGIADGRDPGPTRRLRRNFPVQKGKVVRRADADRGPDRFWDPVPRSRRRIRRRCRGGPESVGAFHDVVVGDDEALGSDEKAGSEAAFREIPVGSFAEEAFEEIEGFLPAEGKGWTGVLPDRLLGADVDHGRSRRFGQIAEAFRRDAGAGRSGQGREQEENERDSRPAGPAVLEHGHLPEDAAGPGARPHPIVFP
jgi:hypothetical protein